MKGFEEVRKIPAILFPDHSQGIISSASFGASEDSATIPEWHKVLGDLESLSPSSSLRHLWNAREFLQGISSLTTSISPQQGMVSP